MKTIKPEYFDSFKCKADKCVDSCCSAGWQIQVDNNSIAKYCNLKNDFFADINNYIQTDNKIKNFKKQNGKCIFLNKGLCSLVEKYGDKYLCDVCRDYPRFYNFVADVNLKGLSLDCEEVANLILNNSEPVKFLTNNAKSKDGKLQIKLDLMFKIIDVLQDRNYDIKQRINNVFNILNCEKFYNDKNIFNMFNELEWLNFDGQQLAKYLNDKTFDLTFKYTDTVIENLLVYFIYRYFISKNNFNEITKFKFALFCTLCCDRMQDFFDINDNEYYEFKSVTTFCRQIEYSTKNVNLIMNFLDEN